MRKIFFTSFVLGLVVLFAVSAQILTVQMKQEQAPESMSFSLNPAPNQMLEVFWPNPDRFSSHQLHQQILLVQSWIRNLEMHLGDQFFILHHYEKDIAAFERGAKRVKLRQIWLSQEKRASWFGAVLHDEKGVKHRIEAFDPDFKIVNRHLLDGLSKSLQQRTPARIGIIDFSENLDPAIDRYLSENIGSDLILSRIDQSFVALPDNLTALIIVEGPKISLHQLYAVDQYLMQGGKLLLLLDPALDYQPAQRSVFRDLLIEWGIFVDKIPTKYHSDLSLKDNQRSSNRLNEMPNLAVQMIARNASMGHFLSLQHPKGFRSDADIEFKLVEDAKIELHPLYWQKLEGGKFKESGGSWLRE